MKFDISKLNLPFVGTILIFSAFFVFIQIKKKADDVEMKVTQVTENLVKKKPTTKMITTNRNMPTSRKNTNEGKRKFIDLTDRAARRERTNRVKKLQAERDKFFKRHRIVLPHRKGNTYLVRKAAKIDAETLFIIGKKGSFTIKVTVFGSTPPSKVKDLLLDQYNVTSDEFKPLKLSINLNNGLSGQDLFEFERGNLYDMFLIARNRATRKTMLLNFTVRNFTRNKEKFLDSIYQKVKTI